MNIVSLEFAALVAVAVLTHNRIPQRWRCGFLLMCSYIFYATFSWHFLIALLVLTAVSWATARRLATAASARGWILATGVGFAVLFLLLLKYTPFLVAQAHQLLDGAGIAWDTRTLVILLPVGMSFYVLQAISYMVDAHQRNQPYSTRALDFSLYMAYFPKITSGPIELPRRLIPQLTAARVADRNLIANGFTLLVLGLFRKSVIADTLFAACPDGLFTEPSRFSTFELGVYFVAYVVAVYNDFAGYTDIVRGVSGLFGIELSPNFAAPLFSRSVSELWGRWHISLSQWLRIHIFLPTARRLLRRNPAPMHATNLVVPPLVTMLISGIWHGIAWNFLLWGALMGLLIVGERLGGRILPRSIRVGQPMWWRAACIMATTTSVIAVCSAFFMPLQTLLEFWRTALGGWNVGGMPHLQIALLLVPSFALDLIQDRTGDEVVFLRWPLIVRAFLLALALGLILLFNTAHLGQVFVYQGF